MAEDVVLVVDDDEAIRDSLALVLEDEGCYVQTASNGRQALDWLRGNPGAARLVFLDIQMPVMDGAAFLREKEADPAIADVPVVVITAGGNCGQLRQRYEVRDCLSKPISYDKILKTVDECEKDAA